jgi:hypothetical protein
LFSLSLDEFSALCLNAIRYPLKIKLVPNQLNRLLVGISDQVGLLLYRARRCTAPPPPGNPLDSCQAFITPVSETIDFKPKDYKSLGLAFTKARKLIIHSGVIDKFQSAKSGFYFTQELGGFNRCIGVLCSIEHKYDFIDENLIPGCCTLDDSALFPGRPNAEALYRAGVEQQNQFLSSFNLGLGVLLTLRRPLFAFSVELGERGYKRRVPNIPEEYAQCVAKGIGAFGSKCLEILFPVEYRKRGSVKMPNSHWYKSGDYKDSTSFIIFEAARVAWDIILDHVPLPENVRGIFKLALIKLLGPHIIFADKSARSKMLSIVFPTDGGKMSPDLFPFIKNLSRSNPLEQTGTTKVGKGWVAPLVATPLAQGSIHGNVDTPKDYIVPTLERFKERLEEAFWQLPAEFILTVRGVLMSYGIAAPALFILNALPHWEMSVLRKGRRFFCSGDDNVSGFKANNATNSMKQLRVLEKKKEKSGMVVHDKIKAFESRRGFILTEDLYVQKSGYKVLQQVPNFPIRSLFPATNDKFEFISVPLAISQYVLNIQDRDITRRITGLIRSRYKREYQILFNKGISVEGPSAIVKWLPSDGLPYNSLTVPGLYSRPQASTEYSKDIDLGDFVVNKKNFGHESDKSDIPYHTKRVTKDACLAILSTTPLTSPYHRVPPFRKEGLGSVETVIENLEEHTSTRVRWAYSLDYSSMKGENISFTLDEKARGIRNPYDPTNWTYPELDPAGFNLQVLPTINGDTFHSDVWCLAHGIAPTSHPLEPVSFESLMTFPDHVIVDVRNTFPHFEESKYKSKPDKDGKSELMSILSTIVRKKFSTDWYKYETRVFWTVLEQPGTPRIGHITNSVIIVVARPTRHNLGADTEVVSLYNILKQGSGSW